MKKYLQDYIVLFSVAGVVVLLDYWTKSIVHANLALGEVYRPEHWLTLYVRIIHWKNTGAAFGMFQSFGGVFTVLSFIVGAAILYYFPQIPRRDWLIRLAMCLLLAGAIGNLLDRLIYGYVTDFVSIWILPVFNIADFSISSGVVLLFVGMIIQEQRQRTIAGQDAAPPEEPTQDSTQAAAGATPQSLPEE